MSTVSNDLLPDWKKKHKIKAESSSVSSDSTLAYFCNHFIHSTLKMSNIYVTYIGMEFVFYDLTLRQINTSISVIIICGAEMKAGISKQ